MECKARMYLHRPLAALSNKACIIRKSIRKSNRDFLCLLRIKKQTEILNQTRSDRFYYTKQFGPYLLFIFDRHFFMGRLCDFPNCAKVSAVFLFQMTMMSVTHL